MNFKFFKFLKQYKKLGKKANFLNFCGSIHVATEMTDDIIFYITTGRNG